MKDTRSESGDGQGARCGLAGRIGELPLVLAGPVVRRVERSSATVWLALRRPARVTLKVFADDPQQPSMTGERHTVALGEHLHLVAVTATGDQPLEYGRRYNYDVALRVEDSDEQAVRGLFEPGVIAVDEATARASLLYDGGPAHPGFLVPPERGEDLRIVHGSCRWPTRGGADTLTGLDADLLGPAVESGEGRPHLLVISGDNIYADGRGRHEAWLELIADTAVGLLGWREWWPGLDRFVDGLEYDERAQVHGRHAGDPEPMPFHVFSLGEYLALHLLVISPVLWPADFSNDPAAERVARFRTGLTAVRRALANVATYNMFDDHEITDDWNLTLDWCQLVYGQRLGRRMVQNGLCAFALVHGWGNQPSLYAEGDDGQTRPGHRLLGLLERWRPDGPENQDEALEASLYSLLGIPPDAADLCAHGEPPRLMHGPDALPWHYQIDGPDYQILVLDVRSWRSFPRGSLGVPDLLSPEALAAQLGMLETVDSERMALTIVVSPVPVLGAAETRLARFVRWCDLRYFGFVRRLQGGMTPRRYRAYIPDAGDIWLRRSDSFDALLAGLAARARVVFLSGDVHLAFAARMRYQCDQQRAIFAQMTSSGMLNEVPWKLYLHRRGYNQPWPWRRLPSLRRGACRDARYTIEYLRAERVDVAGRELVGKNNLGEVTFAREDASYVVIQRTWWRADDDGALAPLSVFRVGLEPSSDGPRRALPAHTEGRSSS